MLVEDFLKANTLTSVTFAKRLIFFNVFGVSIFHTTFILSSFRSHFDFEILSVNEQKNHAKYNKNVDERREVFGCLKKSDRTLVAITKNCAHKSD